MTKQQVIQETADFIKDKFSGEGSGHDWWHMYRVWQLSKQLAKGEGGDLYVIELAALLHDIADWKFHDDENAGPKATKQWLENLGVKEDVISQVTYIVLHISYKGGTNKHKMQTIEGQIVQDADRLDALGAVGIARTFAYGGAAGREMYNPNIKPQTYASVAELKESKSQNHTINHFYEKLLLLKDKMNTKTGKKMAERRHDYMKKFLKEFYAEWESTL